MGGQAVPVVAVRPHPVGHGVALLLPEFGASRTGGLAVDAIQGMLRLAQEGRRKLELVTGMVHVIPQRVAIRKR
jgi:hypothetical protein